MSKPIFDRIYAIVRMIPRGRVATYGQIAGLLGSRRYARVVGYALHDCEDGSVPCYRVVNRHGGLSSAFADRQKELLEADGITVRDGSVDLGKYQWNRIASADLEKM